MHVTPSGGPLTGRAFVMPQPGDIVAGKYKIVRVLGEGGMGIVYEATHQRLRQRVALKMLLPPMLEHDVLVSRFEREARAAAQLRGRHCARVTDVDVTTDGLPYMVMDFLEGHDLEHEIERRGRLPIPEAVDYLLQACAAMVEAHQLGIVHRDLKPSNLFLQRETDGPPGSGLEACIVKVLDFGISKLAAGDDADSKLTDADTVMGTALYMSPEQVKASPSVDARADIWALGVILYEALSGHVPWRGSTPQVAAMIVTEDAPDLRTSCLVPDELAAIVHRCLQRDPARRFPDVKALASALAPFAPSGSAGRNFAENVTPSGSSARSLRVSGSEPSQSPRADLADENARTVLNARGVAEDMMRPRETGTAPGWSQRSSSSSKRRAALVAVLGAFIFGLVAIGSVAFVLRSPKSRAPAVGAVPVSDVASMSRATVVEPVAVEPVLSATEPAPPPPSADEAASAPSASAARPKVAPPVRSARPAQTSPTSAKPPAAPKSTASTPDRPLFL